jgi:ketopantoate hydroxymethyltransferase
MRKLIIDDTVVLGVESEASFQDNFDDAWTTYEKAMKNHTEHVQKLRFKNKNKLVTIYITR